MDIMFSSLAVSDHSLFMSNSYFYNNTKLLSINNNNLDKTLKKQFFMIKVSKIAIVNFVNLTFLDHFEIGFAYFEYC